MAMCVSRSISCIFKCIYKNIRKKKEEINGDSMLKAGTLNNKHYLVTAYQLNLDYDC